MIIGVCVGRSHSEMSKQTVIMALEDQASSRELVSLYCKRWGTGIFFFMTNVLMLEHHQKLSDIFYILFSDITCDQNVSRAE